MSDQPSPTTLPTVHEAALLRLACYGCSCSTPDDVERCFSCVARDALEGRPPAPVPHLDGDAAALWAALRRASPVTNARGTVCGKPWRGSACEVLRPCTRHEPEARRAADGVSPPCGIEDAEGYWCAHARPCPFHQTLDETVPARGPR